MAAPPVETSPVGPHTFIRVATLFSSVSASTKAFGARLQSDTDASALVASTVNGENVSDSTRNVTRVGDILHNIFHDFIGPVPVPSADIYSITHQCCRNRSQSIYDQDFF